MNAALRAQAIDPAAWHHYVSPYPSLVVDTGAARVLVDTGAGNLAPTTGQLQANLRTANQLYAHLLGTRRIRIFSRLAQRLAFW